MVWRKVPVATDGMCMMEAGLSVHDLLDPIPASAFIVS